MLGIGAVAFYTFSNKMVECHDKEGGAFTCETGIGIVVEFRVRVKVKPRSRARVWFQG